MAYPTYTKIYTSHDSRERPFRRYLYTLCEPRWEKPWEVFASRFSTNPTVANHAIRGWKTCACLLIYARHSSGLCLELSLYASMLPATCWCHPQIKEIENRVIKRTLHIRCHVDCSHLISTLSKLQESFMLIIDIIKRKFSNINLNMWFFIVPVYWVVNGLFRKDRSLRSNQIVICRFYEISNENRSMNQKSIRI